MLTKWIIWAHELQGGYHVLGLHKSWRSALPAEFLLCLEILIARDTIKLAHALENMYGVNPLYFVVFWTEGCQFSSFAYVSKFVREHITCV
jgi:hypothetical protein